MVAEKRFRRFIGWEFVSEVYQGRFQAHEIEHQQVVDKVAAGAFLSIS